MAALPLCSLQPETVFGEATSYSQPAKAAVPFGCLMKIVSFFFFIKQLYLMIGALKKDCSLYNDLQRTIHLPYICLGFFKSSSSVSGNSSQLSQRDTVSVGTRGTAAPGSEQ